MGSPARLNPQGIEMAGRPSAFIPRVKRVTAARTSSVGTIHVCRHFYHRLPDFGRRDRRGWRKDAIHLREQAGELAPDAAASALRFDVVDTRNRLALIEQSQNVGAEVRAAIEIGA